MATSYGSMDFVEDALDILHTGEHPYLLFVATSDNTFVIRSGLAEGTNVETFMEILDTGVFAAACKDHVYREYLDTDEPTN